MSYNHEKDIDEPYSELEFETCRIISLKIGSLKDW